MQAAELKKYEAALHDLEEQVRIDMQGRINRVPEQTNAAGNLSHLPTHNADHDAEGLDAEIAAGDEQSRRLQEIEAALGRIDEGTYGTCVGCGRKIKKERLRALPETPYCIDCERRLESA